MIPPLPDMRRRSIRRWLKDYSETGRTLSPEAIEKRVIELDELMMEAFDMEADELQFAAASKADWGTPESLGHFRQRQLELWQSVVADFLPFTDLAEGD